MLKIHKHIVPVHNQGVSLRAGAEILSVGVQHGDVVMWVKEDVSEHFEQRDIVGKMTGETVNRGDIHHGTVQLFDKGIVVHVFEEVGYD